MRPSVLILTLNEEENLRRCLGALSWCDDVVVLDSGSTDGTLRVAGEAGARVFRREFENFAAQRNWGMEEVDFRHRWVLHLDADEVVTAELAREIGALDEDSSTDAYRIPSRMILQGRWLRFSGQYPAYQVRLCRRGGFRFKQVGHGQREDVAQEKLGTLGSPYLHYSFSKGLADWLEKHNRYSTQEAAESLRHRREENMSWAGLVSGRGSERRRALKELSYRLPWRPALRFIYMYFLRLGFLDGCPGLLYCRLMAMYERMIVLKVREMERGERDPG